MSGGGMTEGTTAERSGGHPTSTTTGRHTTRQGAPRDAPGPAGSSATARNPLWSPRRRRLPRWALPALALGGCALSLAVGLAAGLTHYGRWALAAAALTALGGYALAHAVEGPRRARDRLASTLIWGSFPVALAPLLSVLWQTVRRGAGVLDGYFLSHSMAGVQTIMPGGGVYHALLGSVEQVGLATLLATPLGLLTAVYLVEYGRGGLARAVAFCVDVMTGVPSIVAGLFVLSFWIVLLDFGYSGFAGAMALALLMLPIVVRSTEEMLRLVPQEVREAALALGVPRWRTILSVVLPSAAGGISTGVMLAVARVAGESAPIMLLVFGATGINTNPFRDAQSSLPYYVYEQWQLGNPASHDRAWGAALVLIAFVMTLNLAARGVARLTAPRRHG